MSIAFQIGSTISQYVSSIAMRSFLRQWPNPAARWKQFDGLARRAASSLQVLLPVQQNHQGIAVFALGGFDDDESFGVGGHVPAKRCRSKQRNRRTCGDAALA